ncbi:MAG: hypothetical protein V9G15_03205 [Dermatophilaceae bacterium]|nr:hypothetical protein [Actinomycetales bacterium]
MDQTIAWARNQERTGQTGWLKRCLGFVARAYGWSAVGTRYAIDHYYATPASMQHPGDRNPPPGAVLYWKTRSRAGHAALYIGDGLVASTDITIPGQIGIVPATEIERKWNATYIGWGAPYFPNGAR